MTLKYWTPEVIIQGLENQEERDPHYIIDNMLSNFEHQAHEILTTAGYGIHDCYLTPNDPEQNQMTWLNEAFHLLDYILLFEEKQAAITLIEASNLRHYLAEKDAEKIGITTAKLVAIALLPSNTDMTALITEYKNRHRKAGQKKKRSKGIRAAYKELRNKNSELKAIGCWCKLLAMAQREHEITDEKSNNFILKIETYVIKSNDPKKDGREADRIYSEEYRTCKRDGRPITLSTLQDWYTKDKN